MSSSKDTKILVEKKEEPVAPKTFEERLASFSSSRYPHAGTIHPLYMAAAGFTYDDNEDDPDYVTCNSCDWTTYNWKHGEDPQRAHFLTKPDCPFVKAYCMDVPFIIKEPETPEIDTRLQCKRCKEVFESGNKLHAHIKQMKHFSTKETTSKATATTTVNTVAPHQSQKGNSN